MTQVKIIEGKSNEETAINIWLKENPTIKVQNITIIPMHDLIGNELVCNQWYNTIIIYNEEGDIKT